LRGWRRGRGFDHGSRKNGRIRGTGKPERRVCLYWGCIYKEKNRAIALRKRGYTRPRTTMGIIVCKKSTKNKEEQAPGGGKLGIMAPPTAKGKKIHHSSTPEPGHDDQSGK